MPDATQLRATALMQRPSFCYTGSLPPLLAAVGAIFELTPLTAGPLDAAAATAACAAAAGAADATAVGSNPAASKAGEAAAASAASSAAPGLTRWRVHGDLTLSHDPDAGLVELAWAAGPLADMLADAVAAVLLQLQASTLRSPPEYPSMTP